MIGDTKLEILKRNLEERHSTAAEVVSAPPVWDDPLEALWAEAQAAAKQPRARIPRGTGAEAHHHEALVVSHALYTNPENWTRVGGVALIHKETQSLLGNFSEYRHKSVSHAKKLVREETPISVQRTETVAGSWWLGEDRQVVAHSTWHETRKAMVKLHLLELGLFTPLAEVAVQLSHRGIARVELLEATLFADPLGKELMTLPAGLNVLPVMSLDSKLDLRKEIGL